MNSRGIRGAITVERNNENDIKDATLELVREMISQNGIVSENISHVIFTLTDDLNAQFPAKFARDNFDWKHVPMMCYHELNVPTALKKCLRVMIVVNTDKGQDEVKHVYLRGASVLRPDLQKLGIRNEE